jgi:hypothetical protein
MLTGSRRIRKNMTINMAEQEAFLVETTKLVAAALASGHATKPHQQSPEVIAGHAFEIAEAAYKKLKEKGWIGHRSEQPI